jgi:Flp pilus assembly protein TadD
MKRHEPGRHLGCLLLLSVAACSGAGPDGRPAPLQADLAAIGTVGRLQLASAALSGGDTNSALGLLHQAVEADPRSVEAKRALADAYYAAGAFPEAEQAYRDLGTLEGEAGGDHLLGLARVALSRGDLPVAIARFEQARRAGTQNLRALNGLAVAYDLSGRHREAQALYEHLLAQDPTNRAARNNLALSLALSGELKASVNRFSSLVYGPAVMPQARHNLALALGLAGDEEGARDLLSRDLARHAIEDNLAFYRLVRAGTPVPAPAPAHPAADGTS